MSVSADIGDGLTRHARLLRQVVNQVQRHVQLAHRAERAGEPTNLVPGLRGFGPVQAVGQNRDRFAEPPGRHPRVVDANAVSLDGGSEVTFERPRAALQKANQGERSIHGRMTANSTEHAVYNGYVTTGEHHHPGRSSSRPSCD